MSSKPPIWESLNRKPERWLIISWANNDHMDGKYGRLLEIYKGHQQGAEWRAKDLLDKYDMGPLGIVREIA